MGLELVYNNRSKTMRISLELTFKNPAYGRHQISRPMQIVALIFWFPLVSKRPNSIFLPKIFFYAD